MDKAWVDDINIKILERYKPSRMTGGQGVVMPGLFKGPRILFVGQNPGQLKLSVDEDIAYAQKYEDFRNGVPRKGYSDAASDLLKWKEMQEVYEAALRSPKGTLGTFINDIFDEDWSDISITNVYKCPFDKNIVPQLVPNEEIRLLAMQIGAVQPDIIVYIGSIAKQASLYQLSHPKVLHLPHPSYLRKTGRYEDAISLYAAELDSIRGELTVNRT